MHTCLPNAADLPKWLLSVEFYFEFYNYFRKKMKKPKSDEKTPQKCGFFQHGFFRKNPLGPIVLSPIVPTLLQSSFPH